jgi:FOG: TPR repeat, SEL1 subfamily
MINRQWLICAKRQTECISPRKFYLVEAYFTGRGVEQDYRLAVYWLNEAVRRGYAPGQLPLGEIYDKAHRPEQVHSQAWYRQTAEREIAKVQYNFGVWYYNGYHLNKDRQLALEWYLKAAERGLVDAEKAVAGMYLRGEGTKKNTLLALMWYCRVGGHYAGEWLLGTDTGKPR